MKRWGATALFIWKKTIEMLGLTESSLEDSEAIRSKDFRYVRLTKNGRADYGSGNRAKFWCGGEDESSYAARGGRRRK